MHRAVLTGCGAMAKGWLRAIGERPDLAGQVQVVGLVDIDGAKAKALADEFALSDARIGSDLGAMLADVKPDVVFDVVVPPARSGVVAAALEAGAHVLSEKPMAASMDEARRMIELAKRHGRTHAVIQNRRFVSGMRRIRRFLDGAPLGAITAVHCDFFLAPHFGGFREEMDHVLLLDMAIHTFDAMRFVVGRMPQAVYCVETNPTGSWYADGAAANAIFEFGEGVVGTYRGSWCADGAPTSWESAWRIVGAKGTLLWDGHDGFEARVTSGSDGFFRETASLVVPEVEDATETQGHASVIRDFLRAIDGGTAPETVATDNIASLAMVFGAIESAGTGRRVAIEI
ncbi:Gfo/Idh/MocA family protein [Aureimonas leprariae]|uniref:Gfo/Idh/MocA family protein n=1 Tax=Plantimonas leprariae TaxID=2615207 RepID=UPI002483F9CB|nr:Gfo/Idh/MocA family oxidoreductase [Aureimonas leprariae]